MQLVNHLVLIQQNGQLKPDLVVVFTVMGGIFAAALVDALLLSNYPTNTLLAFFLIKAAVLLVLMLGLAPMLRAGFAGYVLFGLAVFTAIGALLMNPDGNWVIFALAVWLDVAAMACAAAALVISEQATHDSSGVRVRRILVTGLLGAVAAIVALPVLTSFLSAVDLIYAVAFCYLIAGTCGWQARSKGKSPTRRLGKFEIPSHRLLRLIAAGVLLLYLVDTLTDIVIKLQVAANLESDQILGFMGLFYGASHAAAFLIQMLVLSMLMSGVGKWRLMMTVPVISMIAGSAILIMPGLWVSVLARSLVLIGRRVLDELIHPMLLVPLPVAMRRKAQPFWQSVLMPAGLGVAGLVVLGGSMAAGLCLVGIGLIWFVQLQFSKRAYQVQLDDALHSGQLDFDALARDAALTGKVVSGWLNSDSESDVLMAADVVEHMQMMIPADCESVFEHESAEVRMRMLDLVQDQAMLVNRLSLEDEPMIRLRLFERLLEFDGDSVDLRQVDSAEDRAGFMLLERRENDLDSLLASDDDWDRYCGAWFLKFSKVASREKIGRLLTDSSIRVARMAAEAAQRHPDVEFTDDLVTLLKFSETRHAASEALNALGEEVIAELQLVFDEGSMNTRRSLIQALAQFQGVESIQVLQNWYLQSPELRTDVARVCCFRFLRQGPEPSLESFARSQYVELAESSDASLPCMLYLVAISENRPEIVRLIGPLTDPRVSEQNRQDAGKELAALLPSRVYRQLADKLETQSPMHESAPNQQTEDQDMERSQRISMLRRSPMFSQLPHGSLTQIADMCEVREFVADEKLFSEGDYPDGFFVVTSGFINLMQGDKLLQILKRSDVFGETELLDETPRLGDAVAVSDGTSLFVSKPVFESMTSDHPEILRQLTRSMVQSLRSTVERLTTDVAAARPEASEIADTAYGGLISAVRLDYTYLSADERAEIELSGRSRIDLILGNNDFILLLSPDRVLIDPYGGNYPIYEDEIMVGRDPQCDVVLPEQFGNISRQHLLLSITDARVAITSLSSSITAFGDRAQAK